MHYPTSIIRAYSSIQTFWCLVAEKAPARSPVNLIAALGFCISSPPHNAGAPGKPSRAFSFTAIPSPGPGINAANPSLAVSTGCDSSSLRIDWSASELGKGICWMKKLGRLAAR